MKYPSRFTFRLTKDQHDTYKTNPDYYLSELRKVLDKGQKDNKDK